MRATNASKSASVPRAGSIASWPPSGEPIAHGEPGSPAPACSDVVGALAGGGPDRVDRRQVDHVEPHVRDRLQAAGGAAQRPAERLPAAHRVDLDPFGAREEFIPGPVERPLPVHDHREPGRPGDQLTQRVLGQDRGDLLGRGGPSRSQAGAPVTEPRGGRRSAARAARAVWAARAASTQRCPAPAALALRRRPPAPGRAGHGDAVRLVRSGPSRAVTPAAGLLWAAGPPGLCRRRALPAPPARTGARPRPA